MTAKEKKQQTDNYWTSNSNSQYNEIMELIDNEKGKYSISYHKSLNEIVKTKLQQQGYLVTYCGGYDNREPCYHTISWAEA